MIGDDRRTGFSRRRQYGVLLSYVVAIGGAAAGGVLLLLSTLNPPLFSALRMSVADVTTPVATLASGGGQLLLAGPRAVGTYFTVHSENARLRREVAATRDLLTRARAINYDNRRLRALLAVLDQADLQLPHPRAGERGFVLVPWAEVDPSANLPGRGAISDLLGQVDVSGVQIRPDLSVESD